MSHTTRTILAAATLTTTLLLCGCTAAATPAPTPSVTFGTGPLSKEPSPSPIPTFTGSFPAAPESEDVEKAAIRKAWEEYSIVYDKFARDPSLTDLSETQYVTTGFWSVGVTQSINSLRKQNLRAAGHNIHRDVKIGDPETNADGVRISIITACNDLSHQYAIDITTGEKSDKGYNGTLFETITMQLGLDNKWRVADYTNEPKPC